MLRFFCVLGLTAAIMIACNTSDGPRITLPSCDYIEDGNCCDGGNIRTLGNSFPLTMPTGVGLGCVTASAGAKARRCNDTSTGVCCNSRGFLDSATEDFSGSTAPIPCIIPCSFETGGCYCRHDHVWIGKDGNPATLSGPTVIYCDNPDPRSQPSS